MTKDRDFKKVVRSRVAKTGESYATARARLRPKARYSFDNLTPDARSALARAEVLARRQNCSYIGTDHVLTAAMQGTSEALRPTPMGRRDLPTETRVEAEGLRPSRQAELAIQRAFELARDAGERQVSSARLAEGAVGIPDSRAAILFRSRAHRPDWLPLLAPELAQALARAQLRARENGAEQVTLEDLRAVLDAPRE